MIQLRTLHVANTLELQDTHATPYFKRHNTNPKNTYSLACERENKKSQLIL